MITWIISAPPKPNPLLTLLQQLQNSLQSLEGDLRSKAMEKDRQVQQIQQLQSSLDSRMEQIQLQRETIGSQQEEIESQKEEIELQREEIVRLNQQLQVEKPVQKSQSSADSAVHGTAEEKPVKMSQTGNKPAVHGTAAEKPVHKSQTSADSAVHGTAVQPLKWPLPLKWRRGKDTPFETFHYHAVILNGMLYIGGGYSDPTSMYHVLQYNPRSGEWSKLPRSPVQGFAMASLNGQLVLVGNHRAGDIDRITVWDSTSGGWGHPYPAMPTGQSMSAAVGYQNYLIVACGYSPVEVRKDTVEVLDSSSGRWYSAQPVPMGGRHMSSAVVGDHWYLSSNVWRDGQPHIFSTHLPTLISRATSAAQTNTTSIWQELPTPPVDRPTLLALQSHLLLVGGGGCVQELHRYDPQAKEWRECGQLPVGMRGPSCAVLPSGEVMVVGGLVEGVDDYSKQTWIGKLDT